MGLDLTIVFPFMGDTKRWLGYERIEMKRNSSLLQKIMEIEKQFDETLRKYQHYGDDGLETRTTTPYGDKLTYVFSDELGRIIVDYYKTELEDIKNVAIGQYLLTIEREKILLWWH